LSLISLLRSTTFADKLLFSVLLLSSFVGIFLIKDFTPNSRTVQIEVQGKLIYVLPLDKNRIVSVEGPIGKTFVEIKDHKVRITDSPCPNKLCIGQGWTNKGGIVCLPNKVVITIGDHEGKNTVPDAITG
jgi:hypothetical protein